MWRNSGNFWWGSIIYFRAQHERMVVALFSVLLLIIWWHDGSQEPLMAPSNALMMLINMIYLVPRLYHLLTLSVGGIFISYFWLLFPSTKDYYFEIVSFPIDEFFSLKGSFLSIWVHCTQVSWYGCTIVMYFYTAMVNNRKQYSYLSFSRSRLSAFLVDNSKKNETSTFLLECAQTRLKLSIVCIFTRPLFCCP